LFELWEALEAIGFLEKSQQKQEKPAKTGKASKNEEKPTKNKGRHFTTFFINLFLNPKVRRGKLIK
jgi:hypothetical protein